MTGSSLLGRTNLEEIAVSGCLVNPEIRSKIGPGLYECHITSWLLKQAMWHLLELHRKSEIVDANELHGRLSRGVGPIYEQCGGRRYLDSLYRKCHEYLNTESIEYGAFEKWYMDKIVHCGVDMA